MMQRLHGSCHNTACLLNCLMMLCSLLGVTSADAHKGTLCRAGAEISTLCVLISVLNAFTFISAVLRWTLTDTCKTDAMHHHLALSIKERLPLLHTATVSNCCATIVFTSHLGPPWELH
jgi:hypothetical protein